jgi:CO/xanthine dehydrogenase Mo-binding subunit
LALDFARRLTVRDQRIDPARVHRPAIDTDEDPFDAHTGSSRTTSSMGAAILDAAAKLRARAEEALGAGAGEVVAHRDGGVVTDDGTWRAYPELLGLADGEQIAMNSRETPTRGRALTVLEQLLGNVGRGQLPRTEDDTPGQRRPD